MAGSSSDASGIEPFALPPSSGLTSTTPERSGPSTSVPPSPSLPTVLEGAQVLEEEPSASADDPYMYRYHPGAASSSDSETVTTYEARAESST